MQYLMIVLGIFTGEYFLKNKIEETIEAEEERKILGGRVIICKHHNKGAILNFGEKHRMAVCVISVMMTLALSVFVLLTLGQKGNGLLKTALSFLLGGAFSNTYDRVKRAYVVDYFRLKTPWKKLNGVIFNLSDFCILISSFVITLGSLLKG